MVARNGSSGICGLTSISDVNQHVSYVAISTIWYERVVGKDLWVVVKNAEVFKQDFLGFLIGGGK